MSKNVIVVSFAVVSVVVRVVLSVVVRVGASVWSSLCLCL